MTDDNGGNVLCNYYSRYKARTFILTILTRNSSNRKKEILREKARIWMQKWNLCPTLCHSYPFLHPDSARLVWREPGKLQMQIAKSMMPNIERRGWCFFHELLQDWVLIIAARPRCQWVHFFCRPWSLPPYLQTDQVRPEEKRSGQIFQVLYSSAQQVQRGSCGC
jgi:hypothetical protein